MAAVLTCLHGRRVCLAGGRACLACRRELDADCDRFDRDVFFGRYNGLGYTEGEWIKAGYRAGDWRAGIRARPAA